MALKLPSGQFPTRIAQSREVAGFVLTETVYSAGQKLPKHSHEHLGFVIVLQGTFTETYGRRTRSCAPLSVILRPSDEVHSDHFHGRGGRCLTVEIPPRWAERAGEYSLATAGSVEFGGGLLATAAARLHRESYEADAASALAVEGLVLEIMGEFSRRLASAAVREPAVRIEHAREMIDAQFDAGPSLSGLAAAVGMHPVHLAREFRKRFGCSVGEYVRLLRVRRACRELADSDAPLTQIALACGFSDQSHFSRVFKRHTGISPSRYRTSLRSGASAGQKFQTFKTLSPGGVRLPA